MATGIVLDLHYLRNVNGLGPGGSVAAFEAALLRGHFEPFEVRDDETRRARLELREQEGKGWSDMKRWGKEQSRHRKAREGARLRRKKRSTRSDVAPRARAPPAQRRCAQEPPHPRAPTGGAHADASALDLTQTRSQDLLGGEQYALAAHFASRAMTTVVSPLSASILRLN